MKKILLLIVALFTSGLYAAEGFSIQTIYTDDCRASLRILQLLDSKSDGAIKFTGECGPGGYADNGQRFNSTINGAFLVQMVSPSTLRLHEIYSTNCSYTLGFLHLLTRKTYGYLNFRGSCGPGGYSRDGQYYPNTVNSWVRFQSPVQE